MEIAILKRGGHTELLEESFIEKVVADIEAARDEDLGEEKEADEDED